MAEKKTSAKKVVKKATPKKTTKKVVNINKITKKVVKKNETSKKINTKKTTKILTKNKTITKKKTVKKIKELGLFTRFISIFTPSFLKKLNSQEKHGKSWGFWFLSNLVLIILITIPFFIWQSSFFQNFPNQLVDKIDDEQIVLDNGEMFDIKSLIKNFNISLGKDGTITSRNMPDPIVITTEKNSLDFYSSLENINNFAEFALIFDSKNILDLDNYETNFQNYIYILKDKIVIYDKEKGKTEVLEYKHFIEKSKNSTFPINLNYQSFVEATPFIKTFTITIFLFSMTLFYLFLVIIRLINAAFWALIFWGIGSIAEMEQWNFEKSFLAMLHFSFITMFFVPIAFILNISVFLYSLIVLSLLFGMNFWNIKNN